MPITYEQALGTLTAMFTDPWTEDSLDTVLRHFEGHMENTVDAVLSHGNAPPSDLLTRLESSGTGASIAEMDAELARQLADQDQDQQTQTQTQPTRQQPAQTNRLNSAPSRQNAAPVAPAPPVPAPAAKKGRGAPTMLPADFLRIPSATSTSHADLASDEALARMLQDKLFAEELKNNPEFAHLAGGRPQMQRQGMPGSDRWRKGQNGEPPEALKSLAEMGENAKKRFQDLATKFKKNLNQNQTNRNLNSGGSFGAGGGAAERRGLLDIHDDDDDDEQEISFVGGGGAEMRTMDAGFAFNKKDD